VLIRSNLSEKESVLRTRVSQTTKKSREPYLHPYVERKKGNIQLISLEDLSTRAKKEKGGRLRNVEPGEIGIYAGKPKETKGPPIFSQQKK